MSTKTTKATARKSNHKVVLPKLNVISALRVTVNRVHETYKLEYQGYEIFVELNDDKVVLKNACGSKEFVFDTVRNKVTRERWLAIAQLIIEACSLI